MKESHLLSKNKENPMTVHKRLDTFIQSALDKYNSVEPWKELYDVTGQYAYYVISNQSTIPDLVIFNKGFNKNDCFVETTRQDFNKFPRKHFILHLKQNKEISPIILPSDIPTEQHNPIKEDPIQLPKQSPKPIQLQQIFQPIPQQIPQRLQQQQQQKRKRMGDSDDEDEPEWGDDDVNDFKRVKIDFKEIPSDLKMTIESKHNDKEKDIIKEIPQQPQVMTGDELFNADEETLFKPIPPNLAIKTSTKNLEQNDKGELTQLQKEDAFFKDLCSNQSQNDNNNNSYGGNNNNRMGMRHNQRHIDLNQPRQFNNNNNMYMQGPNPQAQMMMMGMNPYMQQQQQHQHQMAMAMAMSMQHPQQYINGMSFTNMPHILQQQRINAMQIQFNNPMNQFPPQQMRPCPILSQSPSNTNQQPLFNPINYFLNNTNDKEQLQQEEDDDNEDLMNDFNPKYNMYNPSVFLENPGLVVKKNLFESHWVLMKDNKILGTYNSEELHVYLSERVNNKEKLDDLTISDYQTDIVFRPANLLEILNESIPKLKRKLQMKQLRENMTSMNINMGNYYGNPMMRQGFA